MRICLESRVMKTHHLLVGSLVAIAAILVALVIVALVTGGS
jgi:hypothetical protein